jgi:hypothetical protein
MRVGTVGGIKALGAGFWGAAESRSPTAGLAVAEWRIGLPRTHCSMGTHSINCEPATPQALNGLINGKLPKRRAQFDE